MVKLGDNNLQVLTGSCVGKQSKAFVEYRTKWRDWHDDALVGDFPLFIDVETTNHCNLKCPFCAQTGNKTRKGFMTWKIFKRIIDEGTANGLYGIKLSIRGEPLLHSRLVDFVDYAKKKGLIDVYFNTNATLLTIDIIERLIDAGLDRISISFEGTTKEIYESKRIGAIYENTIANIARLKQIRESKVATNPKIRIQMVNLPDLDCDEYREFWQGKVDEVACLNYQDGQTNFDIIKFDWRCPYLWRRCGVLWDGTILFCSCNREKYDTIESGKIGEVTLKYVWLSEKVNKIRALHKEGRAHEVPVCNECPLRNSEINGN